MPVTFCSYLDVELETFKYTLWSSTGNGSPTHWAVSSRLWGLYAQACRAKYLWFCMETQLCSHACHGTCCIEGCWQSQLKTQDAFKALELKEKKKRLGLEPVVISTRPCSQQNAALYLAAFDRLCNCLPGLVAIACAELETRAMWDQPSGWCLCCPSLPEGEAAEVIPEGCEAGKRGLGMASHHLQLLGKVPLYISARHLNQGKGGAMTLLHASALCDFCVSKTEWPLMEVWRLVPLLKLLSSPQEPWLGCNCCSTSHHEPE